jgi:RNA polymerase sigma-70 factor, ECF subfamily
MPHEPSGVHDRDAAIDAAFRTHAPDIYRLLYAIVRDREAAEELTQETFMRAYDRYEQFDETRPIAGWLHGIATHLALDRLRWWRVRRLLGVRGLREPDLGAGVSPDHAGAVADREAVAALLDELPPRSRAVLVLRHAYGYEDHAIARLLGTTPGAVRTLAWRARERLRASVANQGPAEHGSVPPRPLEAPGRLRDGRD